MLKKYKVIKESGSREFNANTLFDGLVCEEEVLKAFVLWYKTPRFGMGKWRGWHRTPLDVGTFNRNTGREEEWVEIDLTMYHNAQNKYSVPVKEGGLILFNDTVGFTMPAGNASSVSVHIVDAESDMSRLYPDLDVSICKKGSFRVLGSLFIDGRVGAIEERYSFQKGEYDYLYCPNTNLSIIKKRRV